MKKLINSFARLIEHLENPQIAIGYYIMFFLSVISIRNFGEMFIYGNPVIFVFHWHYIIFYTALALALTIVFHFAVRSKIKKIIRVVLSGFVLIFIAPIIDKFFSKTDYYISDYYIGYIEPEYVNNLWQRFFTFFGSYTDGAGVTPGIHVEIFLVLLAIFLYVFIKQRKIWRAILYSFMSYVIIFVYFSAPFFLQGFLKIFGLSYEYSEQIISNFFLLIIFILSLAVFYLYSRRYFLAILKDIRIWRLLHFELMLVVGILIAKIYMPESIINFNQDYLLYFILITLAIVCAWVFSVMTNNIADYDIDKINSPERPLVRGDIDMRNYRSIAYVSFVLACVLAWNVHFVAFLMIFIFMGLYFIYSMPPLRLKTVPILSKFIIALNSLTLLMLGFIYKTGEIYIPADVAWFVLLGFTAAINFIDLKDYQGDKAHGIKTLPTLMGLRNSKILIGALMLLAYLLSYLVFESIYLFIVFALAGAAQFYFITRKNYKEAPVFITYITSLVIFIIYTWLNI